MLAPIYVGIAVLLCPLLERHGEALTPGFVASRILAAIAVVVGVVLLLRILDLSRRYLRSDVARPEHLEVRGGMLRTSRDFVNHGAMVCALNGGSLLLYWQLLQAELVPSCLSCWGIVGAVLALMASMLVMVRLVQVKSAWYLGLTVPLAGQELVFAGWLIMRGL